MTRSGLGAAILWLAASPARGHGNFEDGADFYAGVAHPFLALEHFLMLLAFGLLLGLVGRDRTRIPLILLALAMMMIMAITPRSQFDVVSLAILTVTLFLGLALAAAWPQPTTVMTFLAMLIGVALGLDTDLPRSLPGSGLFAELVAYSGVILSVFLIVLNSMALSHMITHVWNRAPLTIALRAVGSWISAISLMVLAFRIREMTGMT